MRALRSLDGLFSWKGKSRGGVALAAVIGLAAIAAFRTAPASDNADIDVFSDYVVGLWTMQVQSGITQLTGTYAHTHDGSVLVTLNPNGNLVFNHSWGGFGITSLESLEFWVRPNSATGDIAQMSVQAYVNNDYLPAVPLANYMSPPENGWIRVSVPQSALGVQTNDWFRSLRLNASTNGVSVFLDDLKLVRNPGPTVPLIRVKADQFGPTVDHKMFSIVTSAWDPHLGDPSSSDRLIEAGFGNMTFPGGSAANSFDWLHGRDRQSGQTGGMHTDQFVSIVNGVGCDATITINYGSGTPEEGALWVQYANIVLGGNVLYWSVGNEPMGWWEYDTHTLQHNAETYAQFVRDCYTVMKAVDPRIKIGISGAINQTDFEQPVYVTNPRTGQLVNGWSPVLLTRLREYGITPDYYDFHFYPYGPYQESDSFLLQVNMWEMTIPVTRQVLVDFLGPVGATTPIFIGETNSTFYSPGKQSTSLVNAMFAADSWAKAALAGAVSFSWWTLHNPGNANYNNSSTLYGWRNIGDYGVVSWGIPYWVSPPLNTRYPTFYAFKLLKYFAREGDRFVAASCDNELLTTYACVTPEGTLRLLVINKSRERDITAETMIKGHVMVRSMLVRRYGMMEDFKEGDLTTFRAPSPGLSRSLTFPKYSISVIEL